LWCVGADIVVRGAIVIKHFVKNKKPPTATSIKTMPTTSIFILSGTYSKSVDPMVKVHKKNPSLSVKRGEKLSVKQGGGLTEAGRRRYNRATGSHLKAPAPHPKTKRDAARKKSFCARSRGWKGPRGLAARHRWNCH